MGNKRRTKQQEPSVSSDVSTSGVETIMTPAITTSTTTGHSFTSIKSSSSFIYWELLEPSDGETMSAANSGSSHASSTVFFRINNMLRNDTFSIRNETNIPKLLEYIASSDDCTVQLQAITKLRLLLESNPTATHSQIAKSSYKVISLLVSVLQHNVDKPDILLIGIDCLHFVLQDNNPSQLQQLQECGFIATVYQPIFSCQDRTFIHLKEMTHNTDLLSFLPILHSKLRQRIDYFLEENFTFNVSYKHTLACFYSKLLNNDVVAICFINSFA